jgi:hypothetical protein
VLSSPLRVGRCSLQLNAVTAWIPLQDTDEEMGLLAVNRCGSPPITASIIGRL